MSIIRSCLSCGVCCRVTLDETTKPDVQQVHDSKILNCTDEHIQLHNDRSNDCEIEHQYTTTQEKSTGDARKNSDNVEESANLVANSTQQDYLRSNYNSGYRISGLNQYQDYLPYNREGDTGQLYKKKKETSLYSEEDAIKSQSSYSKYLSPYSPSQKYPTMYKHAYDSTYGGHVDLSVPTRINEDGEKYEHYKRSKIITASTLLQAGRNMEPDSYFDSTCGTGMPNKHTTFSQQDYNSHEVEAGTKVFSLLQSACKGDLNTLKRLFHDGTDMSIADYDGRRALHLSAAEGHLDCVKFLIETCGVPHSPRDRWYHTPLDEAKSFKKEDVVKYLEDYIFKTEEQERGAKTFMLLNSACKGDAKTLKRLFQDGVDMRIADYDGRTALHLAAAEGHLECVKFLVEQAEVPSCPKDRWFHTPEDEARNAKHDSIVEFLEDHNRKVNERNAGAAVFSILNSACKGDLTSLSKLAHDGVDMQTADYDGRTALHLAAAEGHSEVVKFLVEKCKVNPQPVDRWQHTPMDEAKNFKNETIVKYLERYISNSPKAQKIFDPKMK